MVLFLTILCLIIIGISMTKAQYGPQDMIPETKNWAWRLQQLHIMNMTQEIIQDTTHKLKHAERIQEEHKHSIGYELGTIAAGILERYLFMLKLYRRFAKVKSLEDDSESVESYMVALNHIQGAYHEIQLEKVMFFKILHAHKNIDPMKRIEDRIKKRITIPPMVNWFPKGNLRRMLPGEKLQSKIWKPAPEIFDVGF